MKDIDFKIKYRGKFARLSKLENGLDFLKGLPIRVVNSDESEDNLDVMFFNSGGIFVFPEKGSLTYSGFEDIKNCTIEYDKDRVQIFNSKAFENNQNKKEEEKEETHYYLHAKPNKYKSKTK